MKENGTLYWYGVAGQVLQETDSAGNNAKEYIFFAGKRIARRENSSGTVCHYFDDHLGSSRVVVQGGQTTPCYEADFSPFGEEIDYVNRCSEHYKFTGKERDAESALDYFIARHYASNLGRFMSTDPKLSGVPFPEHLTQPQSWNMYAYVLNNPLKFIDPQGEDVEVVVTFKGKFTEEERRRILEAIRKYLEKLDVGKVVVRETTREDRRTRGQKGTDFFGTGILGFIFGRSRDFAVITVSDQKAPLDRHLPEEVFAGEFARFRNSTEAFATAVADAVLHEILAHQLSLGENPFAQQHDLLFEAFPYDPYVVERRGTLYDSQPISDPTKGVRPLHPRDQKAIENRLKPINRKYND